MTLLQDTHVLGKPIYQNMVTTIYRENRADGHTWLSLALQSVEAISYTLPWVSVEPMTPMTAPVDDIKFSPGSIAAVCAAK